MGWLFVPDGSTHDRLVGGLKIQTFIRGLRLAWVSNVGEPL
jgi:hypothetical protein